MELAGKAIESRNGVAYWSTPHPDFEKVYLEVRRKEQRLYEDSEVGLLPFISKDHFHYKEWLLRQQSFNRMKNLFASSPVTAPILDLGCGNGWFTFHLSQWVDHEVYGMDVNSRELEQAARVFKAPNLQFVYGDIFDVYIPPYTFSYIILNSVVQYFNPLEKLLDKLCDLLTPNGEIHIFDSPFYPQNKASDARIRSHKYFKKIREEKMSAYYYHHSWEALKKYPHTVLYPKSKTFETIVSKLGKPRNPFPWIMIKPN